MLHFLKRPSRRISGGLVSRLHCAFSLIPSSEVALEHVPNSLSRPYADILSSPPSHQFRNETGGTISEAKLAYDMVSKWSKPVSPAFNVTWFAMKPKIRKEPKGVVLIISPFNYPLWCLLGPLVCLFPLCPLSIPPSRSRVPSFRPSSALLPRPFVHSIPSHPPPFSRALAPRG